MFRFKTARVLKPDQKMHKPYVCRAGWDCFTVRAQCIGLVLYCEYVLVYM